MMHPQAIDTLFVNCHCSAIQLSDLGCPPKFPEWAQRLVAVFIVAISLLSAHSATAAVPATGTPIWYCYGPSNEGCPQSQGQAAPPYQQRQTDESNFIGPNSDNCLFIIGHAPWSPVVGSPTLGPNSVTPEDGLYDTIAVGGSSIPCQDGARYGGFPIYKQRTWSCTPPATVVGGGGFEWATCSSGVGVALYDPVADSLATVNGISTSTSALAAASHTVVGASADGATMALVSVTTSLSAGDHIQLTLSDENGPSANSASAGYLTDLSGLGLDSRLSNGVISVPAISTSTGAVMAFAAYHAPTDFVRAGNTSDSQNSLRNLTIKATDTTAGGIYGSLTVEIVRPPLVLVHGLWGSSADFLGSDLYNTLANSAAYNVGTSIKLGHYDNSVVVTSISPSYGTASITTKGNTLGIKYGATQVLPQIETAIADYKAVNPSGSPIADVQADIVAHSMGGLVVRALPQIVGYADLNTYGVGYVHKQITVDTPHQGSPLAPALLAPTNSCVRSLLAQYGRYAFTSVVVNSQPYSGAVGDLQPSSTAINSVHTGAGTIPAAMVGGQMTSAQLGGAGSGRGHVITLWCGLRYNNPLAKELNPTDWPTLMQSPGDFIAGGQSDAIVPLTSQFDNDSAYFDSNSANVKPAIHSGGTNGLGFLLPSVFDQASGTPALVLTLLNTPVSNNTVFKLQP